MKNYIKERLEKIKKERNKLETRYNKNIMVTEKNKIYIELTRLDGEFKAYMDLLQHFN